MFMWNRCDCSILNESREDEIYQMLTFLGSFHCRLTRTRWVSENFIAFSLPSMMICYNRKLESLTLPRNETRIDTSVWYWLDVLFSCRWITRIIILTLWFRLSRRRATASLMDGYQPTPTWYVRFLFTRSPPLMMIISYNIRWKLPAEALGFLIIFNGFDWFCTLTWFISSWPWFRRLIIKRFF